MHSRVIQPRNGPRILVRPLRHGDVATVRAVFARLGPRSRLARFNAPKDELGEKEVRWLSAVGPNHRALVAYVHGDPEPVALARLVRIGRSGEIAFEVADAYHGRGIGSALAEELVAEARAAGIVEITALVRSDNGAALGVLRRALGRLELRTEGGETSVRAALPAVS